MISLFKKYILNKNFIIWLILFIILLIIIFFPALNFKIEYMNDKNISDYIYIFYVYMLPMSFYDNGLITSLMLDGCFLSIICYISICYINLFFSSYSSITLTRIDRKTWINKMFSINLLFSLFVSFVYIFLFIIMCNLNNIRFIFNSSLLISITYKLLLSLLIPNFYLLFFIICNSSSISLGFSLSFYLVLELLIKKTFNECTLLFEYSFIIILYLIFVYVVIYFLCRELFLRRDV